MCQVVFLGGGATGWYPIIGLRNPPNNYDHQWPSSLSHHSSAVLSIHSSAVIINAGWSINGSSSGLEVLVRHAIPKAPKVCASWKEQKQRCSLSFFCSKLSLPDTVYWIRRASITVATLLLLCPAQHVLWKWRATNGGATRSLLSASSNDPTTDHHPPPQVTTTTCAATT